MPRYTLDLGAMRDRSLGPSPMSEGLTSFFQSILQGYSQRQQNDRIAQQRQQERAFEISKFLAEEKDRHDELAERIHADDLRQREQDWFQHSEIEEKHGRNVTEAERQKREDDLKSQDLGFRTADLAERTRHDQAMEKTASDRLGDEYPADDGSDDGMTLRAPSARRGRGRGGAGGASESKIDPYITEEVPDGAGGMVKKSRLKTDQEIDAEIRARRRIDAGITAPRDGATPPGQLPPPPPGWFRADVHDQGQPAGGAAGAAAPGAAGAGAPVSPGPTGAPTAAAAGVAPGSAPINPFAPDEASAGGFTPSPTPDHGRATVLQQIPDFATQYAAARGHFRGDEPAKLQMAVNAGDHEGVQYLLNLAKSRDPEGDGKEPDLPAHWQAARQAAGQQLGGGDDMATAPTNGSAVQ
jgi:hypothetical protein